MPVEAGDDRRPHPDGPRSIGAFVELARGRWVGYDQIVAVAVSRDPDARSCQVGLVGAEGMVPVPYPAAQVLVTLRLLWDLTLPAAGGGPRPWGPVRRPRPPG